MFRDPRREDHTIWTAVAPDAVFAALTRAVEEQLITQNPAAVIRLPDRTNPGRKARPWSVDEPRQFLESVRRDDDVLYAAYVLVLVLGLGLRKGELLGLTGRKSASMTRDCTSASSSSASAAAPAP